MIKYIDIYLHIFLEIKSGREAQAIRIMRAEADHTLQRRKRVHGVLGKGFTHRAAVNIVPNPSHRHTIGNFGSATCDAPSNPAHLSFNCVAHPVRS